MKFSEIVTQTREWLQREGRVSYRALKLEFALSDDHLDALKEELIDIQELATDKSGKMLVWISDSQSSATPQPAPAQPQPQSPATYTPQHLAERIRAEQAAMESRGAADGKRKIITALFADLKGSTALIEGLDPEDARAIIDPALQLMMDAVHRYDGYVAQALGDGIFALFGAPIAHEDHPQRALYAALRMQEEMRQHSDQSRLKGGIPLQMRVGINTGEVVVRSIRKDDLHTDYVPVGHSTNLAARMEQMANPGSIVISEYTRKLTEGYFDLKALGAAEIKGVDGPLNVYEVMGAGPLRTRLQVSARRGLTRFVGRHSEMEQLQQALEQAKAGHGQIVGVMGEPGLGKSRLFHEFKLTSQTGCLVLEAFAVSYGQSSPYLPLIELLKGYIQIEPGDDERQRRAKVMGQVLVLDKSLEDTLPYLFSLLGIEDAQSSLQQMDPQVRRQRTFEALKKLLLRESLNQPLLLIMEDLHWIDNETQSFLDTLSEGIASTQVLFLVNYRPEYKHDWGRKTYYTQLRLAPLGKAEAEEFLTFLLGTDARLTSLKELILERTDGTPFFMEEVVQTLVEEGALSGERSNYRLEAMPAELHISPTVQGVLAARIDRLPGEEKTLLQQLAVIGRQFPVSLVKQVVTQPEAELYRLLSSLQAKEYLYEQPAFPESEYIFKHALTQDVAYGSVLQEQRKALHERIARVIAGLYKENVDEHYSELAHHYSHSSNAEKAVEYLCLAGQQAAQRSAYEEALRYLTRGIELLTRVPASPERLQQERMLQTTRGVVLIATQGWSVPEVEQTYTRVLTLSRELGDTAAHYQALSGLWVNAVVRGKHRQGQHFAHELLAQAQLTADAQLLAIAHQALGETLYWLGQHQDAQEQFEQVLACHDSSLPRPDWFWYDVGSVARTYLGPILWMLGFPDQGLQQAHEGLRVAREGAHPWSLAFALYLSCFVHDFRQEWKALQGEAEEKLRLCHEYGLGGWRPTADGIHGWALIKTGQAEAGLTQLRDGIAGMQAAGAKVGLPYFLRQIGDAYKGRHDSEQGLALVTEALVCTDTTEERWYEAECQRLKGELTLEKFNVQGSQFKGEDEAEVCFHKALDIARHQQAKSWELRAATSLARLWQGQGKTTEARDLLAPVYNWFTEGFDTADLKDAKALLQELK